MTQNKIPRSTPWPRSTPMAARSRPRLGWCLECKAPIWAGTYDALPIKLDPYPLSPWGELTALLSGHKTWFICNGTLWKRNAWSIETSPAGLGGIICRDHQCWHDIPWGDAIRYKKTPTDEAGF